MLRLDDPVWSTAERAAKPTLAELVAMQPSAAAPLGAQRDWTAQFLDALDALVAGLGFDPLALPTEEGWEPYPLDADGFARAFDPLREPRELAQCFASHGLVVVSPVLSPAQLEEVSQDLWHLTSALTGAPASPTELGGVFPRDGAGVPLAHRGFLEIFHDRALATARTSPQFMVAAALLWGTSKLWVSFDRLALKQAGGELAPALPWHVDQNPCLASGFATMQGLLALVDSPAAAGTFAASPGSRALHEEFRSSGEGLGHYVPLPLDAPWAQPIVQHARPVPMRAGDLVLWDSRTVHANTAATVTGHVRLAVLMAPGRASTDPAVIARRVASVCSGEGGNDREALLHASFKPRFTAPEQLAARRRPEQLTLLGELLYGLRSYDEVTGQPQ